ncbi:MAG: hypothetical protein LBC68_07580 [Prevotellaceae bacterium]|jgi:hypothetical protein|nr:hypothetical protein [Prevotellaceae bacterium]
MFKSWLVANFELAATVLLAFILIPLYFIKGGEWKFGGLFLLVLAVLGPFVLTLIRPPFWMTVFDYVVFIAVGIFAVVVGFSETKFHIYAGSIIAIMVSGTVVGILCAIYAKINFGDTVSRQMLYRSSKVQLFSEEWAYTINRFCMISCCTMWIILAIVLFSILQLQ